MTTGRQTPGGGTAAESEVTDAHCHATCGAARHFVCSPTAADLSARDVRFLGFHPWFLDGFDIERLGAKLEADPSAGVGEIGLDRLKSREIAPFAREAFEAQLALAAELRRPVVLHGAKCWGEVVKACRPFAGRVPAFLFHGFSRSEGLLPEIAAMNGFVSVGPALLNDHAVNYREMARRLPQDMVLVESDRTAETPASAPSAADVAMCLAGLRGVPPDELATTLEANADRFAAGA